MLGNRIGARVRHQQWWRGRLYQQNQNPTSEKTDPMGKLVIENFKKIEKKWFGDWQIGGVIEDKECYALQAFKKNGKIIVIYISRDGYVKDDDNFEVVYDIGFVDGKSTLKNPDVIEDYIYKSTLEDMEFFGESLSHYLNTYYE